MLPTPLPDSSAQNRRFRGGTWLARLALMIGAPILFLLLLEGGLRLVGFGRATEYFIPDIQPGMYRSNPRFTETFFAASFGLKPFNFRLSEHKPAGVARIFVLGESAAMGVPEPGFALAPQLRAQLQAAYPGKKFEVFNLGITAINSHVIRLIARDAAKFEPDVFVIYMGNNEVVGPFGPGSALTERMLPLSWLRAVTWLRSTRVGQLLEHVGHALHRGGEFRDWRGMEMFADRVVPATDPRLTTVYANFAANLADIVEAGRRAGAKVILSTVAANLAECAPFVSVHRAGITADELKRWNDAVEQATIAAELERWPQAEAAFTRALGLDPEYAATEFQLARVLAARADARGAKIHYARALQLDALRFRADAKINDIIRDAAKAAPASITLVDSADALGATATSSEPVSDHHWFFEHVHLTWEGNFLLARTLAPAVGVALYGSNTTPDAWLTPAACADRTGFTSVGRLMMAMRMNELTGRPPFTGQLTYADDRTWLQNAISADYTLASKPESLRPAVAKIDSALEADPSNAFLAFHAATAHSEISDAQGALELNDRELALEPVSAEALAQKGFLLATVHRNAEAERVLLDSADLEPYYFQTYTLLAQLWGAEKQDHARDYFRTLVRRMPDSGVVRLAYARALADGGDWSAAEEQWRAVLKRTPDNEGALAPLAQRLVTQGDTAAAVRLMTDAYAYNARSFSNNERLLQYYAQQGNREKTVEFMQALAASGPVAPALHADLGDLLLQLGRRTDALVEFTKARRAAEKSGDTEIAQRAAEAIQQNGLAWP